MIRIGRRHTGTVRPALGAGEAPAGAAATIDVTWIGPGVTSATAALVPSAG